jgi:hypothetical protein
MFAAVIIPALLATAPAHGEQRVFTVANNPDGYGIDRCLAAGAPCGSAVATAYCRSRDFQLALSFRRLDRARDGAIAVAASDCPRGLCDAVVAIECSR